MKFLFISSGFPGIPGADAGSGIGTFLSEMTSGLTSFGHECHVLIWGNPATERPIDRGGVFVHVMKKGYWPLIERADPGLRDVFARRFAVRKLHKTNRYDWIEIQNDEGIDIGVQEDFPDRTFLRVHTTLAQMVDIKKVSKSKATRTYMRRERRSLRLAGRLLVSTSMHSAGILRHFDLGCTPVIHPLGFDPPAGPSRPSHASSGLPPTFLVVGSLDHRKGSDRLRPALEAFRRHFGPCRCVVVTSAPRALRAEYGLEAMPEGIDLSWRSDLRDEELHTEYRRASVILHLARYESFGYPPVEAAAFARPCVSTRAGVAPDLFGQELSRYLVDGDDPGRIASALDEAVHDRSLGEALARRHAELFSRSAMVSSYLKLLDNYSSAQTRTIE